MLPNPPSSITVLHADQVVAVCAADRIFLAAIIAAMPFVHPDRAHVEAKCLIAGAILRGEADGPYDDHVVDEAAKILVGGRAHPLP